MTFLAHPSLIENFADLIQSTEYDSMLATRIIIAISTITVIKNIIAIKVTIIIMATIATIVLRCC